MLVVDVCFKFCNPLFKREQFDASSNGIVDKNRLFEL